MIYKTTLAKFQLVATKQFFIKPADKNYAYARFFRGIGDSAESHWQALQALEKYFKAGLLLNGVNLRSTKKENGKEHHYGHDLTFLKREYDRVYGDFTVNELLKPERLAPQLWREDPLNYLINKVNAIGSPDVRYGLNSTYNLGPDTFILDALVFELRRRAVCLDWIIGDDIELPEVTESNGKTMKKLLQENPLYQIYKFPQLNVNYSLMGNNFGDALHYWNFAFGRTEEDTDRPAPATISSVFGGMENSFLHIFYTATDYLDGESITNAIDGLTWIVKNIKIPGDARDAYKARIVDLCAARDSGEIFRIPQI